MDGTLVRRADVRRFRSGFATRSEAREWVDREVKAVEALRNGDPVALARREIPTLQELVDEYVAQANTVATLAARIQYATRTFGATRLDRLAVSELRAWRSTLPPGSAWHVVKALRQVLGYAVAVGLLDTNPAKAIPNPEPKRTEILPFATLAEVDAVADELLRHYRAIPVVGCLTGLRPSELLGLERRDVDRQAKVLHVRRVLIDGALRPYGKTMQALRVVPLAERALDALEGHPARIDTSLRFATREGTGRRRSKPPVSPTAVRTRCGTRTRAGRSRRACRRSRSLRRWARASSH